MESNRYTAIYIDSWMSGIHQLTLTRMRRIEQQEGETVGGMLEREGIADGTVFLFHGHSAQHGEEATEVAESPRCGQACEDGTGTDTAKATAAEILKLRSALARIERWHGEFPSTGRYWDEPTNAQPMSYAACFGSHGERDYMRQVARDALSPAGTEEKDKSVDIEALAKEAGFTLAFGSNWTNVKGTDNNLRRFAELIAAAEREAPVGSGAAQQPRLLQGTEMRNWRRDGWAEKDWSNLTEDAGSLRALAREFDNAVGGGGGGFEPKELAEFAERLQAMAERLKRCSSAYP